jgi:hypothetical protein
VFTDAVLRYGHTNARNGSIPQTPAHIRTARSRPGSVRVAFLNTWRRVGHIAKWELDADRRGLPGTAIQQAGVKHAGQKCTITGADHQRTGRNKFEIPPASRPAGPGKFEFSCDSLILTCSGAGASNEEPWVLPREHRLSASSARSTFADSARPPVRNATEMVSRWSSPPDRSPGLFGRAGSCRGQLPRAASVRGGWR